MTTQEQSTNNFFTPEQTLLMASVLDRIIPANNKYPGAGELGIAAYIDGVVSKSTNLRRVFARGLPQIEITAKAAFADDFANLSNDQKDSVLGQVESEDGEFFRELVRQTYNGYYMNPTVLELHGLEARPPQPRGNHIELGNLSLVENVKGRGKVYREVE